jgi:hypothetical protein
MISKDSAEHYTWSHGCDGWRLVDRPELSVIQERMPPGTIEIAPGLQHQVRNDFDADIEFLVISQPTTRGDRVVEG